MKGEEIFPCPYTSKKVKERIRRKWQEVEKRRGRPLTKDEMMDIAVSEQHKAMAECVVLRGGTGEHIT